MKLAECYRLLEVRPGSDLEEIKKSFRRLAFSLHPDMNLDDPDAPERFKRLNEAYVRLKREIEFNEARRAARKAAKSAEAKTGAPRSESTARGAAAQGSARTQAGPSEAEGFSADYEVRQEDVLSDILKDSFARQVFEDIYKQTRSTTTTDGRAAEPAGQSPQAAQPPPQPVAKKRTLSLEWGKRKLDLDLTKGMVEGVKNWVKSNLDDAQTLHLPARQLQPGATIRIQLLQGFSDKDAIHLDVKLPPDFVVGRPIRLRKLGRKLGPWRGDLYLRLLAKPH